MYIKITINIVQEAIALNFKDKITKGSVGALTNTILSAMPKRFFTTREAADKYMKTGDEAFSCSAGIKWTCGYGKAVFREFEKCIEKTLYFSVKFLYNI